MARGLVCSNAEVLDRGPSDHHPVIVDLRVAAEEAAGGQPQRASAYISD
jgi:hypothetical protein